MSIAALNYIQPIPAPPTEKLLLWAIANRADKAGRCWPSRKKLIDDTGLSLASVKRGLARLERKGIILRTEQGSEVGHKRTVVIELLFVSRSTGDRHNNGSHRAPTPAHCDTGDRRTVTPGSGSQRTALYKDEPKREPKEEPKKENRDASAREAALALNHSETKSLDPLDAFHAYNRTAEQIGLPIARSLPPGRRKSLNARFREHGAASWSTVLANIRASSFLQGKNDRGWRPNLDWIIKPENYAKILEGNYASSPAPKLDRSGKVFVPSRWGPGKWVEREAVQ